jgi:hypothetical protein
VALATLTISGSGFSITRNVLWNALPSTSLVGANATNPSLVLDSPYLLPEVEQPFEQGPNLLPAPCPPSTENPFRRVVIDYLVAGGARISWELNKNFTDPPPWNFKLQFATAALAQADWTDVSPTFSENVWFLIDNQRRLYGRTFDLGYRVVLQTGLGVYYSDPAQVWGHLDKRDWLIAREMIRGLTLKYQRSAIPGFLLKARRSGIPCTVCLDPCTNQVTNADCPVCFGQRYVGGYYAADPCFFCKDAQETSREYIGELGTSKDSSLRGSFLSQLVLVQEDVFVARGSDQRYQLQQVTEEAVWRGVPIALGATLKPLPFTHVVYQVPLG